MDAPRFDKSKLPSRHVTEGPERAPHRSYYYAMGLSDVEIHQPFVGVATCWNEAAPCNIALNRQAQAVKLGVKQASDGIAQANRNERRELATNTAEKQKALAAATEELAQAKAAIQVMGASRERVDRLTAAQKAYREATRAAGEQQKTYTAGLDAAGRQAEVARNKTVELNNRMNALKSKALSITVDNTQALLAILQVVGSMARVASKTVTLTVRTNHVTGSWNDQETIEN